MQIHQRPSIINFDLGYSAKNLENEVNVFNAVRLDAMRFMIVIAALYLTAGFSAGKVTESTIQALESALQAFRDFRARVPKQPTSSISRQFREFV